jgi:4-hydroxyacetophenone monooxygenase
VLDDALTQTEAQIDAALEEAHLPALIMSLVHLTGDERWLGDEFRPVYNFFGDSRSGGLPDAAQDQIRAAAKTAIEAALAGGKAAAAPSPATLRRMMDFIAGAEIPERYVPFLTEELGLDDVDQREPRWQAPALKAAASKMKVLIIGAGMSGLLAGLRLSQAGIPFEIIEKNADVGGTWLENSYPGCRVDNPSHLYS